MHERDGRLILALNASNVDDELERDADDLTTEEAPREVEAEARATPLGGAVHVDDARAACMLSTRCLRAPPRGVSARAPFG